ncbi:hypothetical protein JD844_031969 [Phrynosoma platyrhinos]|uniref:C2H2-type domain-containing protein n=1 Tax=Phrynosoma platyrhinos TaxID=52577 RepID=A0ABQ7T490_PHRPL|nr:hypothetical protein JD844_031969 [Phrynosoma platyrhinos]
MAGSGLGLGPGLEAPVGVPPFQFRARHESPDWRRLSSVDVDRVAAEVDVAALQEHLAHVAFCTAERERCPHCQAPADPLLLRLLRLAQLCLEYLLHSQDFLGAQLRAAGEALRAADAHRDLLAKEAARGAQEVRLLKEECRRRRKMLGAQQQVMLQAGAARHQCQFCDKAFMNYSFLHSHLQRRHAEELHTDQKQKEQTDKLQEEINKLKEQLQLTRSQLEAEQHAHMVKLSKEYEEHRSKEEEIRQLFHKWKEEEKEKLASELEKVKEMFMKEFKELTTKNTELENETKWTSKVHALQEAHEVEKHQLTSQIEKLKISMTEELNASNSFYKKRIEELGQRLQDQNDLIISQKHQIQKLATKKSVESIKSSDVKPSAQNIAQAKSSLSSMHEQALLVHMLEPIEELPEDEKEMEKDVPKIGKSKHHVINSLKSNPSLTRELRAVLEQTLAEKLESLGIKSGVHGIPSDHLNRVLMSVESAREERKKQVPDIQQIREQLERQVSFRVAERASCSRLFSSPHLSPQVQQRAAHVRGSFSTVLPKPSKRSSIAKRPCVPRSIPAENTSTPKSKKSAVEDEIPKRLHSVTTPPFSSEEELEEDDIMQSYISPELSQPKAFKKNSKGSLSRFASQGDANSPEEDKVEEIKTNPKASKSMLVQKGTDQVEKLPLSQVKECKPFEGVNVGPVPIQKCAQGVKFTGVEDEDEDDWDLSSLEDEKPSPAKDEKIKSVTALDKNESNAPFTPHAWRAPVGKSTNDEGLQDADTTSELKSSLVTVTDWSDSSDI